MVKKSVQKPILIYVFKHAQGATSPPSHHNLTCPAGDYINLLDALSSESELAILCTLKLSKQILSMGSGQAASAPQMCQRILNLRLPRTQFQ